MSTLSAPSSTEPRERPPEVATVVPRGRGGVVFAAVWLVFLVDSLHKAWQLAWNGRDTLAGLVGLVATVGFAVAYLVAFAWVRRRRHQELVRVQPAQAALVLAGLLAIAAVMTLSLGQVGLSALVYVTVVGAACLSTPAAAALTVTLAGVALVLGTTVPGWSAQGGLAFSICTAGFAMWGVQQLMARNMELLRAREQNARLAVQEERNRFARDLHDILGHSLTVITVKAELAARLFEADPDRARSELADLERLSRDALADVRRAVEGYRELTLPGELARARVALQAADIVADLPNSTDDVPSELRELFAWTVREGVTNVIRHSGARTCTVRLAADHVEIRDDGSGPIEQRPPGHGLAGLRERAAAADAVLLTKRLQPSGFLLQVSAR
ncbi:MAG TPA: sensor histidine kinase [Nocardioidaceae bacterium]|nr:sensor histidine kinase [Nocardioidaceae bacterium]